MMLLTKALKQQLLRNGLDQKDHQPVVKFFTPDAQCTWLISEMEEDGDTLFGLCDLGMGFPEMGNVSLTELTSVRGKMGLPIERDRHFIAEMALSGYADVARAASRIIA